MGIQRRDISGNAGTATRLLTARQIGGVNFDGTANINLPGVNAAGNQPTSGNAATASRALLGADTTTGVSDWNHSSNTQPGHSPTLLLGNAANGPSPVAEYFHCVNYEYGTSKDGTGEITQLAISYASPANGMFMRGRYQNVWTPWRAFTHSGQSVGQVGTYAMLRNYGVQGHIEPGTVVAGANLSYASATGTEARSVPAGSNWLCMGHAMGTLLAQSLGDSTTLFLRIS